MRKLGIWIYNFLDYFQSRTLSPPMGEVWAKRHTCTLYLVADIAFTCQSLTFCGVALKLGNDLRFRDISWLPETSWDGIVDSQHLTLEVI